MKRMWFIIIVLLGGFVCGCSNPVESPSERSRRVSQVTNNNFQLFVDDWDYFWLYERNTHLTKWSTRLGK